MTDYSNLITQEAKKYNHLHNYEYYGRHTPRKKWFSLDSENIFIKTTLDILSNSNTILDIGCGKGSFIDHFYKILGTNIEGVDISGVAVKSRPDLNLKISCASNLPYLNKSFDCVYQFDGMEHIPLELEEKVIEEQFRVAKKYIIHSICTSPDLHHDPMTSSNNLGLAHVNIKDANTWKKVFQKFCSKYNSKIIIFDDSFNEHINLIIKL